MLRTAGLTAASDSGFDLGYLSGVERGVRNPSAAVLARIADALQVDVAELLDLGNPDDEIARCQIVTMAEF